MNSDPPHLDRRTAPPPPTAPPPEPSRPVRTPAPLPRRVAGVSGAVRRDPLLIRIGPCRRHTHLLRDASLDVPFSPASPGSLPPSGDERSRPRLSDPCARARPAGCALALSAACCSHASSRRVDVLRSVPLRSGRPAPSPCDDDRPGGGSDIVRTGPLSARPRRPLRVHEPATPEAGTSVYPPGRDRARPGPLRPGPAARRAPVPRPSPAPRRNRAHGPDRRPARRLPALRRAHTRSGGFARPGGERLAAHLGGAWCCRLEGPRPTHFLALALLPRGAFVPGTSSASTGRPPPSSVHASDLRNPRSCTPARPTSATSSDGGGCAPAVADRRDRPVVVPAVPSWCRAVGMGSIRSRGHPLVRQRARGVRPVVLLARRSATPPLPAERGRRALPVLRR